MQNEMERVQQIIEKYNIKMVAVSENTPITYELTNTIKLGRSEVDLVQDMYDCLLEINKAEYGPK
jgi:protein-arginine kinase